MAGKFSSLADIQLETPLADILSSSEVVEELKVLGTDSAIKKNIYNRQFALNSSGTSGALSDSIIINNQYNSATYADALIGQFDICGQAIEKFVRDVSSLSEQQEYAELSTLRKLVSDKISAIQEEIAALDENADDYDSKVADKRHEMLRFDIKLGKIDARIAKLDPSITGATNGAGTGNAGAGASGDGASTTGASATGNRVVNTGSDDNNHNYGAESDFGIDQLKVITGSSYRFNNWKLVEGKRIGLNGEIVDESDPNYDLYNQYYECDYGGKKVYIICSDLHNTSPEVNMKQSNPILYITQDDSGHTLCYDKSGQAVTYNTGMNILDIDRCSYYRSMGSATNIDETSKPVATPCAPTRTDTHTQNDNGDYDKTTTWGDSAEDADGNKWKSYSNMTFDESDDFQSLDLSDSINHYTVFRKDKGDMGKINVLIKEQNTHEKFFSIQQPDGTYVYYDDSCNPVSAEYVANHII